ncbi:hypothetical protein RRG08_012316 [Elysia crispata]|uniref:Uncharacterized protein n=1 Tax=Elysia crispata TaxID=231223 RepID=A0AAE1EDD4_9GAST|nr:hypothetical protein RRG08_012316 [Elysia crispata]
MPLLWNVRPRQVSHESADIITYRANIIHFRLRHYKNPGRSHNSSAGLASTQALPESLKVSQSTPRLKSGSKAFGIGYDIAPAYTSTCNGMKGK